MKWAKSGSQTAAVLHRTINVLQISLYAYVGSELLDAKIWKRPAGEGRHVRKRNANVAGKFRSIEEHQFVHQARGKRGAVQRRTGFEKHAQGFAAAEFRKHALQIDAASCCSGANKLDALLL